ncbi:MAG: geranylgeranylglyceryl/heptaprenylglyceryl phosphate synthase [Thermoprotei archaeon]|nr:MAG: geranylgeranylglyceryl/heptaprenylglyceryl phosphate synthase [Thermoprotei archaeon]RLF25905.1 MAG: geranylgeranylglyceryl/heptaprenylglyceryl phosphate synthase [Thermoprotei archaeon]
MRVYKYLMSRISQEGAIHLTLIDPDKVNPEEGAEIALAAERAGTAAIMVGGSIGVTEAKLDKLIVEMKRRVKIPIILFPGNITGLSRYADAVWFMSLLNSTSTYYLIEAQALGAPIVKKYGIEPIPMGYIVIEPGEAVGFIGRARPIPIKHPEIAAIYALAAQYLGMKFVYLERGSGAPGPLPPEFVEKVANMVDIPVIVGGGIKEGTVAKNLTKAGAKCIVTGTIVEEVEDVEVKIKEIVKGIREGALERMQNVQR